MKRLALTALALLGSASAAWAANPPPVTDEQPQYEQIDRFHFFGRIDSWRAIDRDTLIIWTTPTRPYLVELIRGSSDIRFADTIGVTSTVGQVNAKLDSVRVRGRDYPIKAIYRM